MGCDIHVHVEFNENTHNNPCWTYIYPVFYARHDLHKCWPCWFPGRNYTAFGLLAGVRDEGVTPFAKPRGLPKDTHPMIRADCVDHWAEDAHTASWITLQELLNIADRNLNRERRRAWSEYHLRACEIDAYLERVYFADFDRNDCRIVFWFDC